MVSSMMKAESAPLDKLEQQKQILEWQQEDYRALNTALYSFKDKAFNLKLERTFNAKNAASSNETVAGVTAGANAVEGTYTIKVNNLATGVSKASTDPLASGKDTDGNNLTLFDQFTEFSSRGFSSTANITVTLNGTELQFDLDQDTINTVVSKINEANLGVTASYDNSQNRFFLNSSNTGSDAEINISSDSAYFFSKESVDTVKDSNTDSILNLNIVKNVKENGQDASIDIGDAAGLKSSTNAITVNGLTLNLKNTGNSTITVTRDTDAVVASIKEFVDAYNETLSTLNSKMQEERDRDYAPLTDAQKKEMSETEIKNWEAKAHSGLLRNDTQLQDLVSNFRSSITGIVKGVGGQYDSLSEIGITTQSYKDNGKLYIDEDALRQALSKDPDGVKDLFANTGSSNDEKGASARLYDI
ncbi:MAG TPA: flagellar filament capping protein FliD, partial [Syntrophomonadaceae bacterium]|nr:flagellar filament capping protein FliD [Syntrophomonadaceae bacterium]